MTATGSCPAAEGTQHRCCQEQQQQAASPAAASSRRPRRTMQASGCRRRRLRRPRASPRQPPAEFQVRAQCSNLLWHQCLQADALQICKPCSSCIRKAPGKLLPPPPPAKPSRTCERRRVDMLLICRLYHWSKAPPHCRPGRGRARSGTPLLCSSGRPIDIEGRAGGCTGTLDCCDGCTAAAAASSKSVPQAWLKGASRGCR